MKRKCNTCKKKRNNKQFRSYIGRSGNKLFRSNCRDCEKKVRAIYNEIPSAREKKRIRDKKHKSTPKARFSYAKLSANRRNIDWAIEEEQYFELISKDCSYCGGFFPPVKSGIGLDRKISSEGYTIDNVVPCCELCNKLKNNFLTPEETSAAIKAIIKIRGKK